MKNRVIVIYEGVEFEGDTGDYNVINITSTTNLSTFSMQTGTQVGSFPALVDMNEKVWLPIDGTIEEMDTKIDNLIQQSKSLEQKEYEDQFFLLTKEILTAVDDPRKDEVPVPKLGMDELSTMLETLEATDFNTSIKYSLNLLKLDAALKRFNILWWDNAVFHGSI